MTVHSATKQLLPIANPHFRKGYELGRTWYFSSIEERIGEPDDQYVLDNMLHYCQQGLHNDPEWLAERVGFLFGMVSCNVIAEA